MAMLMPTRCRPCIPVMTSLFKEHRLRAHPPFRQRSVSCTNTQNLKNVVVEKKRWISLRAIITRWVPLGSIMYVGLCYVRSTMKFEVSQIELKLYEKFSLRLSSRIWGKLASCYIPVSVRGIVYGTYARIFQVNLEEAAEPDFKCYASLSEFFTRALKDGARIIEPELCVSPCDGVILNCGPADSEKIEQVKGVTYSLKEFLGTNVWSNCNNNENESNYYYSLLKNKSNILHQCIIYLAPGDYHRFHSPCNWTMEFRRHFAGKLLSVNPWIAQLIPGLFCMNERAAYVGEWQHGFFSMTAVGATNVGSIQIYADPSLHTNKGHKNVINESKLKPTPIKKGDLFGQFNMGSTIVLLFEAPKDFEFSFKPGDRLRVGEALSSHAANKQR